MTPEEWDDMTGTMWGSFDAAVEDVKRSVRNLRPDQGFAVYSQYRLEGSATASLPLINDVPPPRGGRWEVRDRQGRVVSRFGERSTRRRLE